MLRNRKMRTRPGQHHRQAVLDQFAKIVAKPC